MSQRTIDCFLWDRRRGASILLWVVLAAGGDYSHAQVVLDGKFGTSGALTGPNYNITAAMGSLRGNNLFQSFSQFNLVAGDVATFSGPPNVQNILSRVTGGNPSSIDGTIRSDIQGANFFFINPSGILFGPNAVVDVSGSFAASTANYLKLANGARFMASLDADDSMLSTDPVVAFGFLDGASGSLEVHGSLKAAPGTSLSLIGSTVLVGDGATLEAVNGSINLTGVGAAGEVSFPPAPVTATGQLPPPPNSGGGVVIRGGRLVVENAIVGATTSGGNIDIDLTENMTLLNGGQVTTGSSGAIKGGDIVVNSPSVVLDGQDTGAQTGITAQTTSDNPQAQGGNIVVHANSVEVLRTSEISTSSFGAADAGRIDITTGSLKLEATDASQFTGISADAAPLTGTAAGAGGLIVIHANTVEVGYLAQIEAFTQFDANAGTIDITAHNLTINNGRVSTYTASGAGNGGDIHIQSDSLTLDGPFSSIIALSSGTIVPGQLPPGHGGTITINTGSLQVLNDAYISATTYGDGNGGNINIIANSILLDTATFQYGSPGITAASSADFFGGGTVGKGGDITITTGSLTLAHGMPISATTSTLGDGGNIRITAGSVSMGTHSSIQSASQSTGRAGTISIQSDHDVLLTGNSSISTSAPQSGAGDILVSAGLDSAGHVLFPNSDIRLLDSQINAEAGPGGGGNIDVKAASLVYSLNGIQHVGLTAQAVGDGGNLNIDPSFLILNNSGLISKSTTKNGGNITILSDYFFQSASTIDASAPFGIPGTVTVTAPEVDLSGSLIGLPSSLLDVGAQLRPDCGVRLSGNISSFIVLGQGGLPIEPGGFVPSGAVQPPDESR